MLRKRWCKSLGVSACRTEAFGPLAKSGEVVFCAKAFLHQEEATQAGNATEDPIEIWLGRAAAASCIIPRRERLASWIVPCGLGGMVSGEQSYRAT